MDRSSTPAASASGVSFFTLLTILFIALKLTGYIDWSWWWVLAPLWLPAAAVLLIVLVGFLVTILVIGRPWR